MVSKVVVDPMTSGTVRRIRTALFVDFDNLFSGLFHSDRDTAFAFGENPGVWLERLDTYGLSGARRDLLVRRAYLNPEGSIADSAAENGSERVKLSRFRSSLTRAGFEVVDCPSLCATQKNAADIRMVLDARDLLDVPVTYDEFIIASGDSDFTPLINRLRAFDRRTVIMTTIKASAAYRSVAHQVFDGTDVMALTRTTVSQPEAETEAKAKAAAKAKTRAKTAAEDKAKAAGETKAEAAAAFAGSRNQAVTVIRGLATPEAGTVDLSEVGKAVRATVTAAVVDESKWFGAGSLSKFLRVLPDGFVIDGDDVRHPGASAPEAVGVSQGATVVKVLPPVVTLCANAARFPTIDRTAWRSLLESLSVYSNTHEFNFSESSGWTRDRLVESGFNVNRRAVYFAVVALTDHGQTPLDEAVSAGVDGCIEQIVGVVRARVAATGGEFNDDDEAELRLWMGAR